MFDRDTGKPKGYGFCEYKDQETAVSAMRNLNNYELNGRTLRVDSAASEKNKEEGNIFKFKNTIILQIIFISFSILLILVLYNFHTFFFLFLEMIAAAPPETNPYGPTVPPSEAPSAITQAVASLPPEQMFELMKQMKVWKCSQSR